MKKCLLILLMFGATLGLKAQHNYDNQSVIYSNGGNLGIGTTTPSSNLSIYGTLAEGWNSGIELTRQGGGKAWITVDPYGMKFRTPNNGHGYYFKDNDNNTSLSIKDGGHVGIGTENPNAKLDINGGSLSVSHSSNQQLVISQDKNSDGTAIFDNQAAVGDIKFQMSGSNKLIIKRNGNVGIGTTTPDSKLTVKGKIHAREVKVTVNAGSDFVFDKEYNLPSLHVVAKYIKENKHLPEIASAKEMEKDGIHLAEFNMKLLQKIEELTLYMIEQDRRIEQLEAQQTK